jgi:hypothetical protein
MLLTPRAIFKIKLNSKTVLIVIVGQAHQFLINQFMTKPGSQPGGGAKG